MIDERCAFPGDLVEVFGTNDFYYDVVLNDGTYVYIEDPTLGVVVSIEHLEKSTDMLYQIGTTSYFVMLTGTNRIIDVIDFHDPAASMRVLSDDGIEQLSPTGEKA